MKQLITLSVLFAVTCGVAPADTGNANTGIIEQGRRVFQHVCAPCHGAGPGLDGSKMLPGTATLAARYQGAVPALLEERPGLSYEFLDQVVRHGQGAMPMFRKTEITDAELKAVAVYLNKSH